MYWHPLESLEAVQDVIGQYQPTLLGEGVLDYTAVSAWLHANKPDMYLLREEMNPETARQDIEFMCRL